MSLQVPAPTPVHKAPRIRPRHKYSAARAFYITILLISAIAVLSLLQERRRIQHAIQSAKYPLFTPTTPGVRQEILHGNGGELVPRDQAVRWHISPVAPDSNHITLTLLSIVPTG